MTNGEQSGYKLESDALKFASWCIRRIIHGSTGRKFGTLELDEQMGTAIHAVVIAAKPDIGAGLRIGSAAAGAAWRAIRDIARNLNVADLEIAASDVPPSRQSHHQHRAGQVSDSEEKANSDDR